MKICVLSRNGRGGRPDPRGFHLGQRRHAVVAILDCWDEASYRYFEVEVYDGRRFVLRHDALSNAWELAACGSGRQVAVAAVRL
jgi:hypothetical protein